MIGVGDGECDVVVMEIVLYIVWVCVVCLYVVEELLVVVFLQCFKYIFWFVVQGIYQFVEQYIVDFVFRYQFMIGFDCQCVGYQLVVNCLIYFVFVVVGWQVDVGYWGMQ